MDIEQAPFDVLLEQLDLSSGLVEALEAGELVFVSRRREQLRGSDGRTSAEL